MSVRLVRNAGVDASVSGLAAARNGKVYELWGHLCLYKCLTAAPNGKLYAAPLNAENVLEVDPERGSVREIGAAIEGSLMYECLTAAPNGKLYAAPFCADRVLEVDPERGSVRQIGPSFVDSKEDGHLGHLCLYECLTAAPNGKLYAAPSYAEKVLEVDPERGSVREIGAAIEGSHKYECLTAAPNGKLYAAPCQADRVLEVDPENGSVRQIGATIEGVDMYECLTAAPNGKLYAAPFNAEKVLEVDPERGSVREIGAAIEGDNKYECLTAAPNGKLYAAPCQADGVLEVDPENGTIREIGAAIQGTEKNIKKYACLTAAPNGKLYAAPAHAEKVLEVDPEGQTVRQIGCYIPQEYDCLSVADGALLLAVTQDIRGVAITLEIYAPVDHVPTTAALPTVLDHHRHLLASGAHADVTLVVGERRFPAHRAILSRATFFDKLFTGGFSDARETDVVLQDVDPRCFSFVLAFIYTNDIDIAALQAIKDVSMLESMLDSSERFGLDTLRDSITEQACRTIEGLEGAEAASALLRLHSVAKRYALLPLRHLCLRRAKELAENVMMSAEFHELFRVDRSTYAELVQAITRKRLHAST